MSTTYTREQILALAPDAQVAAAGQSLAQPIKWQAVGRNESVIWGSHQGSGSSPYLVAVDLAGPAFKCSCPSRKRPCKHALGLFLVVTNHPYVVSDAPRPEWVQEWSAGRAKTAEKAEPKAGKREQPVSAEQPARPSARELQREKRVQEGAATLARWLDDLIRQGLGSAEQQPPSFWEAQAARLVDAQAPGLARRVRALGALPHSGEGWPARLLAQAAQLHLLLEGYARLATLPPELQQEIRREIGWTQDQDALRGQPGVRDQWLVVGQRQTEEDRLRVQRTWLWGVQSQAGALVLDFAPPGRPLECSLVPGTALDAELVFWPGATQQRALVKAQDRLTQLRDLPGYATINAALAAYGAALAANPWLDRWLVPLTGIVPTRQGQDWLLRDGAGCALPLRVADEDGWRLLALSGGRPLALTGEWDGERLTLLSVWDGARLQMFGGPAPEAQSGPNGRRA